MCCTWHLPVAPFLWQLIDYEGTRFDHPWPLWGWTDFARIREGVEPVQYNFGRDTMAWNEVKVQRLSKTEMRRLEDEVKLLGVPIGIFNVIVDGRVVLATRQGRLREPGRARKLKSGAANLEEDPTRVAW